MTGLLTLIICTRNRVSFLHELLNSLSKCDDFTTIEVMVVDNGSTNLAADFCRKYASHFSNIRYVHESRQGLSFARNTGLQASKTPFVLFLDDDCTITADYIRNAKKIVREYDPDFFGGPIIPRFRGDEPAWLRHIEKVKIHQPTTGFHPGGRLSGGNFGMRRALVNTIGFFQTNLGMRGDRVGVYEEKELLDRYFAVVPVQRRRIYYDVDMPIYHWVLPHKFQKRYHLRRALLNGIAEAQSTVYFEGALKRFLILQNVVFRLVAQVKVLTNRGRPPVFVALIEMFHQGGRLIGIVFPKLRGSKVSKVKNVINHAD